MTNEDIAALPDITPANMLKLWKYAHAQLATSQSYRMPDGRMLTRENSAEVRKNIDYWQAQVTTETDTSGGIALVNFGDPQ